MEPTGAGAAGILEVVVFPWLAFGHMIPFFELSKRLRLHATEHRQAPARAGAPVPLPPVRAALPLPGPGVDGLPEGAESTADVPPVKGGLHKKAFDGLAAPFAAFLADAFDDGRRPDWIVNDFCHHWLPPIAGEHKVLALVHTFLLCSLLRLS